MRAARVAAVAAVCYLAGCVAGALLGRLLLRRYATAGLEQIEAALNYHAGES